jgi:2'-5' RNA ligase
MRVFFALWPAQQVQDALARWARACREACGGRSPSAGSMHLTLAFLGEVEPERVRRLAGIAAVDGVAPFELVFDRLGYWRHNRIAHAAASVVPSALATLAGRLAAELGAAGFRTEAREFVPHVTLARQARRAPGELRLEPIRWPVEEVRLVESIRVDGKASYQTLQSWTLDA